MHPTPNSEASPVARPRRAASLLRTGSTTTSPLPLPTPPSEKLKQHNLENLNAATVTSSPVVERKLKVGYKNIPSLDAITARLAKARTLSIDGSPKLPDAETIEDPRLQNTLPRSKTSIPFTPAPPPDATSTTAMIHADASGSTDYEAGLTIVGEFSAVEIFCRYFNWLKPPSKFERNYNYHLFKSGIKSMWENPANANGGKWMLTMKGNPALLDRCWSWLAMALVGEELEDDGDGEGGDMICGAVVSFRSKVDRIQLWTRGKDDVERLNAIAKKMVKLLDTSEADAIGSEFQYNTEDRPPPSKFLAIQTQPQSSYRASFHGGPPSGKGYASPASGPGEAPAPMSAPPGAPGSAFGSLQLEVGVCLEFGLRSVLSEAGACPTFGCVFPPDQTDFLVGQKFDIRLEVHAPVYG
ncbi:hypothetical protein JAAARDRAFT_197227 [Jaapia argillacea MUCL 33604]|uniref:Translation initiation factor eIF4e n=1 Tax=Jaapia argillacea MUCL 33604 TaxID=933084 RepID=A0A067PFU8_9AGAM|nr:hypothetical protein JAAARDRAFT_197227 [Jaapia argillacea MUCL 33604]